MKLKNMPQRLKKILQKTLLSFFLCGFVVPVHAQTKDLSGHYENGLSVVYNPGTQMIKGYVRAPSGSGQFSCIFYFAGKLENGVSSITSYTPGEEKQQISGTLKIKNNKEIEILLQEEHGGCMNVMPFARKDMLSLSSQSKAYPDWLSLQVIKNDKAFFYSDKSETSKRKAYLVKWDSVGVIEEAGSWLKVEYHGEKGVVSGFMKKSDFFNDGQM